MKKLSDTEIELEKSVGCKKASKSSLYRKRTKSEISFSEADARIQKPATLLRKRLRHRCFPVNLQSFYP